MISYEQLIFKAGKEEYCSEVELRTDDETGETYVYVSFRGQNLPGIMIEIDSGTYGDFYGFRLYPTDSDLSGYNWIGDFTLPIQEMLLEALKKNRYLEECRIADFEGLG